jgi:hypothetical protein
MNYGESYRDGQRVALLDLTVNMVVCGMAPRFKVRVNAPSTDIASSSSDIVYHHTQHM